ncbi:polysaccharide deacetylase family protein [Bacillus safensis]|uniref:polysaccharide deacetylase family protein n=1 Tax=Bacillus safensis TaxID=561879 RepID=UPI003810D875
MSNSYKRSRTRLKPIAKISLSILTVLAVTYIYMSWNALANRNHETANGNTEETSMSTPKMKHKTEQEQKLIAPEIGKVVYLTFDDGPHPVASKEIMKLLKKYEAKGTFFMLKPHIDQNVSIVQQMVESGHSVGSHGVTHQVDKIYHSPENFADEMKKTLDDINESTKADTHLVRAPYGSKPYITAPFRDIIQREHFLLWDWTIDSEDWKYSKGEFVQNVINQVNNLEGKEPLVVLMHEKTTTAAHLEELLKYFHQNGYQMKALNNSLKPVQFKF